VALLRKSNPIIDGERYFLSPRIQTLKASRAKIRPETVPEPSPLPPSNMHRHERRPRGDEARDAENEHNS
jgi:hypothetical protein